MTRLPATDPANSSARSQRCHTEYSADGAAGLCISPRDSRYLSTVGGQTFIPLGLNLCFPRFAKDEEEGIRLVTGWMRKLAENGGNFVRFWLGHPFLDIEPELAGRFDGQAVRRLGIILDTAQALGLRVKLTFEHFRNLDSTAAVAESFAGAANFSRPQYAEQRGGPADSMDAFWQSPASRHAFLNKLGHLAAHFANHPALAACELWNEINACSGNGWEAWTEAMLPEVKQRFPRAFALQSLGSFCADYTERPYRWLAQLADNDLVQIHRYLDLGAQWPVCHQSIDVLCADAVHRVREWVPERAILLAEAGAVEPDHAAPSALYEKDREGIILHDVLFAPFFSGAVGSGQCWHWDFYVARHDLWWHFGRFRQAVSGFDPAAQTPRAVFAQTDRLRIYMLAGKDTSLIWLRNKASDWQSELVEGRVPAAICNVELTLPEPLAPATITAAAAYDPWTGSTTAALPLCGNRISLPDFRRSLVLPLSHS